MTLRRAASAAAKLALIPAAILIGIPAGVGIGLQLTDWGLHATVAALGRFTFLAGVPLIAAGWWAGRRWG